MDLKLTRLDRYYYYLPTLTDEETEIQRTKELTIMELVCKHDQNLNLSSLTPQSMFLLSTLYSTFLDCFLFQ